MCMHRTGAHRHQLKCRRVLRVQLHGSPVFIRDPKHGMIGHTTGHGSSPKCDGINTRVHRHTPITAPFWAAVKAMCRFMRVSFCCPSYTTRQPFSCPAQCEWWRSTVSRSRPKSNGCKTNPHSQCKQQQHHRNGSFGMAGFVGEVISKT